MSGVANDAPQPRSGLRSTLLIVGFCLAVSFLAYGVFTALDLMARERNSSSVAFKNASGVRLKVKAGSVTLSRGTTSQIVGTRTVTRGLRKPSFTETVLPDGTLVLSTNCPGFEVNCAVDYTLQVPATMPVDGELDGGNFNASGLSGAIDIASNGGRVRLTDVSGASRINSSGGGIGIKRSSGQLDLRSSGGNISVDEATSDNATISASGGNVTLRLLNAPRSLSIVSSGGSVTVVLPATSPPYAADVSTSGGSRRVEIATDPKSAYHLRIDSSGGDVDVSTAPG